MKMPWTGTFGGELDKHYDRQLREHLESEEADEEEEEEEGQECE